MLIIKTAYKENIILENTHTKYTEDQFLSIVKSHDSNQPNKNSTIKTATKVAEGLKSS
jgi:hypothetical protein